MRAFLRLIPDLLRRLDLRRLGVIDYLFLLNPQIYSRIIFFIT